MLSPSYDTRKKLGETSDNSCIASEVQKEYYRYFHGLLHQVKLRHMETTKKEALRRQICNFFLVIVAIARYLYSFKFCALTGNPWLLPKINALWNKKYFEKSNGANAGTSTDKGTTNRGWIWHTTSLWSVAPLHQNQFNWGISYKKYCVWYAKYYYFKCMYYSTRMQFVVPLSHLVLLLKLIGIVFIAIWMI